LLVDVDVERPVREAQRLRERVARAGARGFGAAPAARGEHTGDRQERAARSRTPQQVPTGQDVSHSGASSESTTKVESGLQLMVSRSPGAAPFSPGDAFWR